MSGRDENELVRRVMRLEMALMMLVNQLRGNPAMPSSMLDLVEKILTAKGSEG